MESGGPSRQHSGNERQGSVQLHFVGNCTIEPTGKRLAVAAQRGPYRGTPVFFRSGQLAGDVAPRGTGRVRDDAGRAVKGGREAPLPVPAPNEPVEVSPREAILLPMMCGSCRWSSSPS